jgi:hydrogenase maturation protein HypF
MPELIKVVLKITGIVQGVGFRPFIYSLAERLDLKGWVRNTSGGVEIEMDGSRRVLDRFVTSIKEELPALARIDTLQVSYAPRGNFRSLKIIHSEGKAGDFQPISPDVSICDDCLRELFNPSDRRYLYPFINCTNCGPRYTIIKDVPYDRPQTTMSAFPMCPQCAHEYQDPGNRRFHAQPVACPKCGPTVWIEAGDKRGAIMAEGDSALREARRLLAAGKILAIKGLGGFHLACDATNSEAVAELSLRKLRVDRPFALMMPDINTIERYCNVNEGERFMLLSRQRPIVILGRKPDTQIANQISPGLDTLGVMLPYTPLHYLLFHGKSLGLRVLVMTSGNISEEPIAIDNEDALARLANLADAFLMHNREIRTRCDDSVIRVVRTNTRDENSPLKEKTSTSYFLRRSRGYAPDSVSLPYDLPQLLAVGPELKNTFCLTRAKYAFLSHHIGDMENYETLASFRDGVDHFEKLFKIQPQGIAYDMHPDYLTTHYAIERCGRDGIPGLAVQHHHAHIAACMAENGHDGSQPVIGIAFDGTGYGDDGSIWGGEILIADYKKYDRWSHLESFPLPGGDISIKRPSRVALALLWQMGMDWSDGLPPVIDHKSDERQILKIQLERNIQTQSTSSMGRLFDAAAALAGVRQRVNYEAQAAIEFEAAIDREETGNYPFDINNGFISYKQAISLLVQDFNNGKSIPTISARFHNGIVEMVRSICKTIQREAGLREVVLSGGVWQNIILLERVVTKLTSDGFRVYFHQIVPPNDGGVALGQVLVSGSQLDTLHK